jgi:lipopolysaccharide transport system ATP-binding protein
VGIIGRNGAGKTTLLKILSRITEPTEGSADIFGRVGSLLEVGTGFHPELTGRENIYLNGAILGMKKVEIERKFDEIVAFAEIEKFIDTPVKFYSSGMYVRLAFAVAAHLEPEILLVDEVLAVGDIEFQKKCIGKMEEVANEGRTVIYVSHNISSVQNLCSRCILLEVGRINVFGETDVVVHEYLNNNQSIISSPLSNRSDRIGSGEVRFRRIKFQNTDGNELDSITPYQPCCIKLEVDSSECINHVKFGIGFDTVDGLRILTIYSEFTGSTYEICRGLSEYLCKLPDGLNLRPDTYMISIFIGRVHQTIDFMPNASSIVINEIDFYGSGYLPMRSQGPMLIKHEWQP